MNAAAKEIIYKGPHSEAFLYTLAKGDLLPAVEPTTNLLLIFSRGTFQVVRNRATIILYPGEHIVVYSGDVFECQALTNGAFYMVQLAPKKSYGL